MDRVLAPAPANGAALNVSTGGQCSSTSPHRVELLGAPQGGKGKCLRTYGFYSVLSYGRKPGIQRSRAQALSPRSSPFPLSSRLFPLLLPYPALSTAFPLVTSPASEDIP